MLTNTKLNKCYDVLHELEEHFLKKEQEAFAAQDKQTGLSMHKKYRAMVTARAVIVKEFDL